MAFLRRVRDERRISARRSLTSTVPADVVPTSRAWLSDRPGWCVDRGETLDALTTCDLWLALARGDVTPQTKVWREGMPYWDQVANVPEFALAMPDASVWGPASQKAATPPETAPVSAVRPAGSTLETAAHAAPEAEEAAHREHPHAASHEHEHGASHAGPSFVDGTTMAPPGDLVTPAPMVVEERETVRPPARSSRRAWSRIDRSGAISVAIGAALAVLALTLATTGPAPSGPSPERASAQHAAAGAPVRGVELPTQPAVTEAHADTIAAPITPASAAPSATQGTRDPRSHGPRAADRGQRRARTGTGDPRR